MKITVEVEISPDEVPLATELINTLRLLTEHVTVVPRGGGANGGAPAHLPQQPKKEPPVPAQPPAPSRADVFRGLVAKVVDQSQVESVTAEAIYLLQQTGPPGPAADAAIDDFVAGFQASTFNVESLTAGRSVLPQIMLLRGLPEAYKKRIQEQIIASVLRVLTAKRPLDAPKADFFQQAEAFAALVSMDVVSVKGAIKTVCSLLNKPENRAAALTMLAKTLELCHSQIDAGCDAASIAELLAAVDAISAGPLHGPMAYDVQYIAAVLHKWRRVSYPLPPPRVAATGLRHVDKLEHPAPMGAEATNGGAGAIYSLAYDEARRLLVSAGADGALCTWGAPGLGDKAAAEPVRQELPAGYYANALEVHSGQQLLLACATGVPTYQGGAAPAPAVMFFGASTSQAQPWASRGAFERPNARLVACVRAWGGDDPHFVVAETLKPGIPPDGRGGPFRICIYDLTSSPSLEGLQPKTMFCDHEAIVTCLAVLKPNPAVFISGSMDETVRVWDRRQQGGALFAFAAPAIGGGGVTAGGQPKAHAGCVMGMDLRDDALLTCGMDKVIRRWDLRMLGSPGGALVSETIMQAKVSKVAWVAHGHGELAAAATLSGLSSVDFSGRAGGPAVVRPVAAEGRGFNFRDIRWVQSRGTLFGAEMRVVDCFSVDWSG